MSIIDLIIFAVAVTFLLWIVGVLALIIYGAKCLAGIVSENGTVENEDRRRGYHGAPNRRIRRHA